MNQPKIFIVGVGRSGTTLLQNMLNTHSEIAFTPDIDFLRKFLFSKKLDYILKSKGKNEIIQLISNDGFVNRLNINITKVLNENDFGLPYIGYQVYLYLLRSYLQKQNKLIIGDKDPRSIEYIPLINYLFPDAFIIHIIRDPRDVLISKMKARWSQKRPYFVHVLINEIQLRLGLNYGKRIKHKYIEVLYEDLLVKPRDILKIICNKIGVSYEESMLNFQESSKKLVFSDEMQWKKETHGPLLKSNFNKWQHELSDWKIIFAERCDITAFNNYGYKYSRKTINVFGKFWIKSFVKISNILISIYIWNRNRYNAKIRKFYSSLRRE